MLSGGKCWSGCISILSNIVTGRNLMSILAQKLCEWRSPHYYYSTLAVALWYT